jgi:hypothetical protein
MTQYLSGRPLNYTANEFVQIYAYEPVLTAAFDQWQYSRSLETPDPLEVVLSNGTYTVEILATYISTKEAIDLIKVTSDKQNDRPAYYVTSYSGSRKQNGARIIGFSAVEAANNLVTFKSKSGEFLYFNIADLSASYTDLAS